MILEKLLEGSISLDECEEMIRNRILKVADFAKIDLNRETRTGIPEVILCSGKSDQQIIDIASCMLEDNRKVILSRVPPPLMNSFTHLPCRIRKHPEARLMVLSPKDYVDRITSEINSPTLAVVSAGTADVTVATEAKVCAEELGCDVFTSFDVGVAGIHRLLPVIKRLHENRIKVVIVAAGREGALPSVIAGLIDGIVIGLPVSSGYGYGGEGKAALMGMLQSCTPLLVVNIDAGIIAGMMGAKIAKLMALR
ncbi:MAG: nickel pincer cofactor biosynthesis protein LarB [Candidatus Thermoplasmatota archaeon]|nr:nickel pincer cofactor biosynthesis protein LarB [Candidatus Thermoplasmatota archaeon]